MGKIIGIDLGTTNSCVSVYENGEYKVIHNSEGGRTTPSIVAVTKDKEILVGEAAKRQAVTNPLNTLYGVKRLIGRRFDDPAVKEMAENAAFNIVKGSNGDAWVEFDGKPTSPSEISAKVLAKMKQTAEDYLGEDVTEAVVTVPAYFNDAQRQATKDAGKIAGLEVKRIINEPTAAALAFGYQEKDEKTIIVYDLGGGTFDVSVLKIEDGIIEVKATNGDTFLGGENFDERIIDYIVDEFKEESGIDLRSDKTALQRVKESAEKAKIELSSSSSTDINQPFIAMGTDGQPVHLAMTLTRAKVEEIVADLVERTIEPCKKAMQDAGITTTDIDDVLLVGGMTRMPKVKDAVQGYFGKKPNQSVNPDEVVAAGASVQGGILAGDLKDVILLDVTPLSLGIRTAGGVFTRLIERNTTIPTKLSKVFSTAEDMQSDVHIQVGQGEDDRFEQNKYLGDFVLEDIPPAAKGVPEIEVTFDIDADGVLNVHAENKGTGVAAKITVQANGGLSEADVELMIKEAEANKEASEAFRKAVEAKNEAESFITRTESNLEKFGEQLSDETKQRVTAAVASMRDVLDGDDNVKIADTFNALQEAAMSIGQELNPKNDANAEAGTDADVDSDTGAEEAVTEDADTPTAPKKGGDKPKIQL